MGTCKNRHLNNCKAVNEIKIINRILRDLHHRFKSLLKSAININLEGIKRKYFL